jgi:hypothetical protein
MTHQHKDVERTSAGRNRRSPAAVSGTLDAAKRAAKIAELRELMEKVERRWQAPERSKSQRGSPRRQRRDASRDPRHDGPSGGSPDVRNPGPGRAVLTNLDFCRAQAAVSAARVVRSPSIVGLINSATPGIVKTLLNSGLSIGIN